MTRSLLDPGQIIQDVHDPATHELRVQANVSVSIGGEIAVEISDTDDSIKIGDGTGKYALVDSNRSLQVTQVDENGDSYTTANPLPVEVISSAFISQEVQVIFNETSVPVGIETTVNSYTAPAGKISYLLTIVQSGENRAQFTIYKESVMFDRQYTNVTKLDAFFDYKTGSSVIPGMVVPVGETIEVKAVNAGMELANYTARIMVLEITI